MKRIYYLFASYLDHFLLNLMLLPGTKKGDTVIKIVEFRLRDAQQNVYLGKPVETRITVQ